MENLWPVELLSGASWGDSSWSLIHAQAAALSQSTNGLVQGELRPRESPLGKSMFMYMFPTDQPMKGYEFMAVRSPQAEGFPLSLEVFHLGESHRIWQARNEGELRRALTKILHHEATLRIVKLLAGEAVSVKSSDDEGEHCIQSCDSLEESEVDSSRHMTTESARPIAIGGLIQADGKSFATVSLLGIAGFVHEDELRRLVMKPDIKGSAVSTFNDRYIVTITFLDAVKMALNSHELKVLQNEVQNSLAGASR
ncbi:MAG: hypothetical protein H7274_09320 [Rhodoferax sp.]|nr:hypothetical protein [Rhodoferax sp.]